MPWLVGSLRVFRERGPHRLGSGAGHGPDVEGPGVPAECLVQVVGGWLLATLTSTRSTRPETAPPPPARTSAHDGEECPTVGPEPDRAARRALGWADDRVDPARTAGALDVDG